jgi:biopolymer transport protein ExbD
LKDALKVEIRADKRTLHGDVARVLAMVREAGVIRPAIDTRQVTLEP